MADEEVQQAEEIVEAPAEVELPQAAVEQLGKLRDEAQGIEPEEIIAEAEPDAVSKSGEPDPFSSDAEILRIAQSDDFGLSESEARAFGTPKRLETFLRKMLKEEKRAEAPAPVEAPKPDDSTLFGLPKDHEIDETIVATFSKAKEYMDRRTADLEARLAAFEKVETERAEKEKFDRIHEAEKWLDKKVSDLPEPIRKAANDSNLKKLGSMIQRLAGITEISQLRTPAMEAVFEDAVMVVFKEQMLEVERAKLTKSLERHAKSVTTRASGRNGTVHVDPEAKALNKVGAILRDLRANAGAT